MSSANFTDLSLEQVREMGFSLRLHPREAILAALRAVQLVYRQLYDTGSFGDVTRNSMPQSELDELNGQGYAATIDERFRAISEGVPT